MVYGFWDFWVYIVVNIAVLVYVLGKRVYQKFFDKRAFVFIFFPDKQVAERRVEIIDNSVTIYFKHSKETRTYTVNDKDLNYFNHVPIVMVWDNNPLSLRFKKDIEANISKEENEQFLTILNKLYASMKPVPPPLVLMKSDLEKTLPFDKKGEENKKGKEQVSKEDKEFAVLSARELWGMAHTNLTMGIWNKAENGLKKVWDSTKWLIIGAVVIGAILHLTGTIDIWSLLGATPPNP